MKEGELARDDDGLNEHDRAVVKATVKEFMAQLYQGVGKGLLERIFWLVIGGVVMWVYGHPGK